MGSNKQYDGYRAFEYLDAGRDFEPFEFQDEPHFFGEPHEIELDSADAERADALSDECEIVSMHEHAVYFPKDMDAVEEYARQGRAFTAYDALTESNLDAVGLAQHRPLAGSRGLLRRRRSKNHGWQPPSRARNGVGLIAMDETQGARR